MPCSKVCTAVAGYGATMGQLSRRVAAPLATAVAGALLLAACSSGTEPDAPSTGGPGADATPTATASAEPSASPTQPAPDPPRPVRPADLDAAIATATVAHLAGRIGPRHATSPAYDRAARWVARRLRGYGLRVHREEFPVPAGNSWGTEVGQGTSVNVVATPVDFDRTDPHLLVGAHLDTVPVAPGAEDNASGVGVLFAVAEALEGRSARLPVVLVAFGAEEPRGTTDADHHYGSRFHVAGLGPAQRRALRGMLSLDRVGVGEVVPVCTTSEDGPSVRWRRSVLAAAERARVPHVACVNSASDHLSFAREGLPAVRLGSTPYAGYHSAGDVPAVVSEAQLRRTGRVVLAWLAGP
jgi:hypothetical protein